MFELNLYGIEILKMLEKYVAEKGFELNLYGIEMLVFDSTFLACAKFELNLYGIEIKVSIMDKWLDECLNWTFMELKFRLV